MLLALLLYIIGMLDQKILRRDLDVVVDMMRRRGMAFDADAYAALEARRKKLQVETETRQAKAGALAAEIGRAGGDASDELAARREESAALKRELAELGDEFKEVQTELHALLAELPNMPHESVPDGASEDDNREVSRHGEPPQFDFEPRDHLNLGEGMAMMDDAAASRISGSRFAVLFDDLARLHRALAQWMLDVQVREHGYTETYTPYLVHADSAYGTGQLPKFEHDLFKTTDGFYLIPTAEVPLTNLYRETIIDRPLPLKLVAHTPCFRSEAGSYGRDTRGLLRQHQFDKVEMVQIVESERSWEALEELTGHACVILERLGLAYRKVVLCAGDLGFSAAKTYDLEVWLPGQEGGQEGAQGHYREISSCSNMTDFQARRMKMRWRRKAGKPELVHTLNGSGLAVGRTLIAVMENYQTAEGGVRIPEVLQPYMNGQTLIAPRAGG